jgi:decaprenyl-phosphate phosphoribosyltransferase
VRIAVRAQATIVTWYFSRWRPRHPTIREDALSTPAEAVDSSDLPSRAHSTPSLGVGLIRLARPRQWVKNLLVFVAPAAAGVLLHGSVFWRTVAAFGIFCLEASGTYFLNDAVDAPEDRAHPLKRYRPVAAGVIPVSLAIPAGICFIFSAVVLGQLLAGWHLALVIGLHGAINVAYSLGLKNEPILDLAVVSAGFVLRAIAGGVAAGVGLSDWFLIVTSFGSLLVVTGKRSGEKELLDEHQTDYGTVRQTLGMYTPTFLRTVRGLSAAVTVTAYCLWAFERTAQLHPHHDPIWFQLTIIPFTIALLHVLRLLDSGGGAAPEELALQDHRLQIYGLVWIAMFAVGIYG